MGERLGGGGVNKEEFLSVVLWPGVQFFQQCARRINREREREREREIEREREREREGEREKESLH